MSNTYQKKLRRAQLGPLPGEIAVPEQVLVSMAEVAESACRPGLDPGAVRPGLRHSGVMSA